VSIGEGTVVVAGAVINPGSKIGKHVIINTCASVGHDCTVNDAVHIASGARIGGHSIIGQTSWIGIGAVLCDHVKIGKNCVIGAGAVVQKDLPDDAMAYGVPAKIIKSEFRKKFRSYNPKKG
jgi:sugar O-acyltransferase (sialic acid O-acetyltransferase NeuD family)